MPDVYAYLAGAEFDSATTLNIRVQLIPISRDDPGAEFTEQIIIPSNFAQWRQTIKNEIVRIAALISPGFTVTQVVFPDFLQ